VKKGRVNLAIFGAVLILLAIFPWTLATDHTLNLFVTLFVTIILAQSWNVLAGYGGQVSLGNAAFFGTGVLTFHLLAWAKGMSIFLALPLAGVGAVVLASFIGLPALRLRGAYFSIGTLALAEAVKITVGNLFPMTVYMPTAEVNAYSLSHRYYLAFGVALLVQVAAYALVRSKAGFALRAVRDDDEAADTTGVNLFKYKYLALVFSSFFSGLAGAVFAYHQTSIVPNFPFSPQWTFEPLAAAAVGGAGTLLGPVFGSAFLVLLMEVFALFLGKGYLIIFGALFICVVLFFPAGLSGALGRLRRPGAKRVRRAGQPNGPDNIGL
jgi:branched-chain amino acid transport system permease protein